ncbi:Ferrochelatase [Azospirillaceae bacterium]
MPQNNQQRRVAVVLFNLGGPDSLDAIKPFLFNLFRDPQILGLPAPFRTLLAWTIATRRAPKAAEIYKHLGGRSPLLENTQAQAQALETALNALGKSTLYKTFIAMRYWRPDTTHAAQEVKAFSPDEIVLLPLYPQWSITTTYSSFLEWKKQAKLNALTQPTRAICCYPTNPGFISAYTALLHADYQRALTFGKPRILFSAHGLPKKVIARGDPYQTQCETTAQHIVERLCLTEGVSPRDVDWLNCYQSRVGPMEWIGPSTIDEIARAGRDRVPLVLVPLSFVSEHSETRVELDIEYRALAETAHVPGYFRTSTVGVEPAFIEGLCNLVTKSCDRTCSNDWKMCWNRIKKQ